MKAFKFKLESVLQLRERAENEAQQSHAASGRKLEAVLAELAEAEVECKALGEQLANMQKSSFRPAEREILWKALKYQQEHCTRLTQKADLAVKDLEEKRVLLLAAQSDREAMTKLQEKERQEYDQTAEKEEREMIDDLVNARHSAKRSPAGSEANR